MKEKLLQIMNERGIKSAQLAALTGLSTSTVADILSGKVNEMNIGVSKVVKIADALHVSVEYLYGVPEPGSSRAETDQELALLQLFRELDDASREKVLVYVSDMKLADEKRREDQYEKI